MSRYEHIADAATQSQREVPVWNTKAASDLEIDHPTPEELAEAYEWILARTSAKPWDKWENIAPWSEIREELLETFSSRENYIGGAGSYTCGPTAASEVTRLMSPIRYAKIAYNFYTTGRAKGKRSDAFVKGAIGRRVKDDFYDYEIEDLADLVVKSLRASGSWWRTYDGTSTDVFPSSKYQYRDKHEDDLTERYERKVGDDDQSATSGVSPGEAEASQSGAKNLPEEELEKAEQEAKNVAAKEPKADDAAKKNKDGESEESTGYTPYSGYSYSNNDSNERRKDMPVSERVNDKIDSKYKRYEKRTKKLNGGSASLSDFETGTTFPWELKRWVKQLSGWKGAKKYHLKRDPQLMGQFIQRWNKIYNPGRTAGVLLTATGSSMHYVVLDSKFEIEGKYTVFYVLSYGKREKKRMTLEPLAKWVRNGFMFGKRKADLRRKQD